MATTAESVVDVCRHARDAFHLLARLNREAKDACLRNLADRIDARVPEILEANAADVLVGQEEGLNEALIDRLTLNLDRIEDMSAGVREIAALPDPVGEIVESWTLPNGLDVAKKRAPIGVIGIVYEARPNVTIDAAALCLKSANAVVLRGSSAAESSNVLLAGLVTESLLEAGLPAAAVSLLAGGGHEQLRELAQQEDLVDLIIPRGGEGLKRALKEVAQVPVMYAAAGNCHVYVHEDADLEMARRIAYNAKVQRPGRLQRGRDAAGARERGGGAAAAAARRASRRRRRAGRRRGCARERGSVARRRGERGGLGHRVPRAEDGGRRRRLARGAVRHINGHGTGHSDAIVTASPQAADDFTEGVDSAAVYVNASTRFTDGYEFGMGAEIGNSTQKLHARGPIGLRELTSVKYVVHGQGQVRE